MKNILLLIVLTVLQSYCLTVISQDLQFYREDIVFSVSEDQVSTDAVYSFCNPGGKEITTLLFYPFPPDTRELIDSLVVTDLKAGTVIPFREGKSGVFFPVSVNSYGQASYRVYFRQKLVENHFEYILTSTGSWGRPLEFANFELQVPTGILIDSLSYPPDSSFMINETRHYTWKKKDFMPDKDFVIEFKSSGLMK
jgi:hypothetical protein